MILCSISKYVTDEVQCSEVISLILPFLGKRITRQETLEIDLLVTLNNLMRHADKPQQFLM